MVPSPRVKSTPRRRAASELTDFTARAVKRPKLFGPAACAVCRTPQNQACLPTQPSIAGHRLRSLMPGGHRTIARAVSTTARRIMIDDFDDRRRVPGGRDAFVRPFILISDGSPARAVRRRAIAPSRPPVRTWAHTYVFKPHEPDLHTPTPSQKNQLFKETPSLHAHIDRTCTSPRGTCPRSMGLFDES